MNNLALKRRISIIENNIVLTRQRRIIKISCSMSAEERQEKEAEVNASREKGEDVLAFYYGCSPSGSSDNEDP